MSSSSRKQRTFSPPIRQIAFFGTDTSYVALTGANSYKGGTYIRAGATLKGAASGALGTGDVSVAAKAKLELDNNTTIADTADLLLITSASVFLNFTGTENIAGLSLDGVSLTTGTWGATGSGATHINDAIFSGAGVLNVVPEPSTFVLLTAGLIGLLAYAWRKRKN